MSWASLRGRVSCGSWGWRFEKEGFGAGVGVEDAKEGRVGESGRGLAPRVVVAVEEKLVGDDDDGVNGVFCASLTARWAASTARIWWKKACMWEDMAWKSEETMLIEFGVDFYIKP